MGQRHDRIDGALRSFIEQQKLFFVATAAPAGRVNISPKGMDTLRVVDDNRILWLSLTGSGNETAAHLVESPRMTLMWCAFEGTPKILRAYGEATAVHPRDPAWVELVDRFPPLPGARQIYDMRIDMLQTSCGFGVPLFAYSGDREQLRQWTERKGAEGIRSYWADQNQISLDGKPTGISDARATRKP